MVMSARNSALGLVIIARLVAVAKTSRCCGRRPEAVHGSGSSCITPMPIVSHQSARSRPRWGGHLRVDGGGHEGGLESHLSVREAL